MNIENLKIKELRLKLKLNQAEFSNEIGLKQGSYSDIERGKIGISGEILKTLIKKYRISPIWLYEGIGEMFFLNDTVAINVKSNEIGIPLIPVEAFAGFDGSSDYSINLDMIEERYVVPLFDGKGVDFLIPVRGSSMYPKYSSGDIVACKFVKEILFIQWNKVYVLDTKSQGAMIKRLKKSLDETKIICKSDNKEYDDFEVPLSDINNLALVIGVIRLE